MVVINYIYIRLIFLVFLSIITFLSQPTLKDIEIHNVNAIDIFIIFIFAIVGTMLIIWIQYLNKNQNVTQWQNISWNTNPFSLKQPILFFNFCGWSIIVSYILPTINTYLQYPNYDYLLKWLFLTCLGIGIIIGSHISCFLFCLKNQVR